MRKELDGPTLTWPGKRPPGNVEPIELVKEASLGGGTRWGPWRNRLIHGDNLGVMAALSGELAGTIDLIYADPPFATGGAFRLADDRPAYGDAWEAGLADYLQTLHEQIVLMERLLSERGSLYLHLDWRAGHYARLLLDEVFGREGFRNAIVWHYGGRGAKAIARQFPRNHDVILLYTKSAETPFTRPRTVERIPLDGAASRGLRQDGEGRWFKTAPRGDYTDESVARLDREGRIHRTRNGGVRIKYFLPVEDGLVLDSKPMGDVWNDIPDMMHAPHAERTEYPTQKPEALLARIIEATSSEGGLVADFFCGSGTTAVVAERLGRRWIACDQSEAAIEVARNRLSGLDGHERLELLGREGKGMVD